MYYNNRYWIIFNNDLKNPLTRCQGIVIMNEKDGSNMNVNEVENMIFFTDIKKLSLVPQKDIEYLSDCMSGRIEIDNKKVMFLYRKY